MRRAALVRAVLDEAEIACADPLEEIARLQQLQQMQCSSDDATCAICLEEGPPFACHIPTS